MEVVIFFEISFDGNRKELFLVQARGRELLPLLAAGGKSIRPRASLKNSPDDRRDRVKRHAQRGNNLSSQNDGNRSLSSPRASSASTPISCVPCFPLSLLTPPFPSMNRRKTERRKEKTRGKTTMRSLSWTQKFSWSGFDIRNRNFIHHNGANSGDLFEWLNCRLSWW